MNTPSHAAGLIYVMLIGLGTLVLIATAALFDPALAYTGTCLLAMGHVGRYVREQER